MHGVNVLKLMDFMLAQETRLVGLHEARAAVAELIESVDKLFGADMEYCMMMDGKQDQIDAIEFAKSALKRVKGE